MSVQDTDTEAGGRAVAKHFWLDQSGNVCDEIEQAHGIRYVDVQTGETYDHIPKNPDAVRMLSCFGARTLATNVASGLRNKKGGGHSGAEQVAAIKERFDLIEGGQQFVDRTRDGGPQVDVPKLVGCVVEVLVENGLDPAKHDVTYATLLQQVEEGKQTVRALRTMEGVEAKYRKAVGTKVLTAADLLASVQA